MSDDLIGKLPDEIDPDKDYFSELVGETGKFKTKEDLARSKVESDRHIKRLEAENAALRSERLATSRLEEIADRISKSKPEDNLPRDDNQDLKRDGERRQPEAAIDIDSVVDKKLRERENVNRAAQALKGMYGDEFQRVVDSEAKKLGLDTNFVNELARTNPSALVKLVGDSRSQPSDTSIPRSALNSQFKPVSNERTKKYYDEMLKSDPQKYWSRQVQLQEHNDALRLGEAFFD